MVIKRAVSFIFAASFLSLGFMGCKETSANILVEERSGDIVNPVVNSEQKNTLDPGIRTTASTGVSTTVVTAEPAVKEEEAGAGTEAQTAEDKTGAVAVKARY